VLSCGETRNGANGDGGGDGGGGSNAVQLHDPFLFGTVSGISQLPFIGCDDFPGRVNRYLFLGLAVLSFGSGGSTVVRRKVARRLRVQARGPDAAIAG
jgi:hypothetical protein